MLRSQDWTRMNSMLSCYSVIHKWRSYECCRFLFMRSFYVECFWKEVNGSRNNSHDCFALVANSLIWLESEEKRIQKGKCFDKLRRNRTCWKLAARRRWTELLGGEQEFLFSFINYQNFFARVFYSNKDFWSLLKFAYMINSISQSFIYTRLFR